LAPITFDTNTFPCYGGSYFATIAVLFVICRIPLNRVGPSMPTSSSLLITATIAYYLEYVHLQNCLLPSSLPPPRALQLSTSTLPSSFLSELHHTSMGHARLVCTQLYIGSYTSLSRSRYRFLFSSNGPFRRFPLLLSFTTTVSVEETLMDFGYTSAPNLIHQGASVITEISSAHGDKNSTSSAHSDKNSTSSKQQLKSFMALVTAFQKGQILYKN
jgi:hypothetical protein